MKFAKKYEEFTTGSILRGRPKDINVDTEYTFFVFKVVIGRAYFMRRHTLDEETDKSPNPKSVLRKGYDSIYVHEDVADEDQEKDLVTHKYRIFDKEKVRLLYKVRASIKIDQRGEMGAIYCDICKHQYQSNLNMGAGGQTGGGNLPNSQNNPKQSEIKLATCYNKQLNAHFCDEHWESFHDKPLLKKH